MSEAVGSITLVPLPEGTPAAGAESTEVRVEPDGTRIVNPDELVGLAGPKEETAVGPVPAELSPEEQLLQEVKDMVAQIHEMITAAMVQKITDRQNGISEKVKEVKDLEMDIARLRAKLTNEQRALQQLEIALIKGGKLVFEGSPDLQNQAKALRDHMAQQVGELKGEIMERLTRLTELEVHDDNVLGMVVKNATSPLADVLEKVQDQRLAAEEASIRLRDKLDALSAMVTTDFLPSVQSHIDSVAAQDKAVDGLRADMREWIERPEVVVFDRAGSQFRHALLTCFITAGSAKQLQANLAARHKTLSMVPLKDRDQKAALDLVWRSQKTVEVGLALDRLRLLKSLMNDAFREAGQRFLSRFQKERI